MGLIEKIESFVSRAYSTFAMRVFCGVWRGRSVKYANVINPTEPTPIRAYDHAGQELDSDSVEGDWM